VTPVHKKSNVHKIRRPRTNSNLERRVTRLESRVNRTQDSVALLEDRFNRSPSGNIKADKILFKSGSAELVNSGKKYFDILAEKYKTGNVQDIIIKGYASKARKKGLDNLSLSEQRALAAQTYLKAKGVNAEAVGIGETDRYTVNTNIIITYKEKN
jgi:outer membrane protein OmpA-like peptidoglycan-associated protein